MKHRRLGRPSALLLALALLAGASVGAFAQVTVSAGFALSSMSVNIDGQGSGGIKGGVGYGGNIYIDYLLPVGVPVSLGIEVGYDGATLTWEPVTYNVGAVPLLLRVAYHFDLMAKLDLYGVGKIGYAIGIPGDLTIGDESFGGVGFGIDVGAAYYFTSLIGLFVEGGFDRYQIATKSGGAELKTPFSRFLTFGLSFKK